MWSSASPGKDSVQIIGRHDRVGLWCRLWGLLNRYSVDILGRRITSIDLHLSHVICGSFGSSAALVASLYTAYYTQICAQLVLGS